MALHSGNEQFVVRESGIIEWTCPHGIGHPLKGYRYPRNVHGCDGCCKGPKWEAANRQWKKWKKEQSHKRKKPLIDPTKPLEESWLGVKMAIERLEIETR